MVATAQQNKTVKAKPLPRPPEGDQITEAYFLLCYYYPQFTIQDAANMRFDHVIRHIEVARKERAADYLELLNISTAPHTKKGQGVKKLASHYKAVISG